MVDVCRIDILQIKIKQTCIDNMKTMNSSLCLVREKEDARIKVRNRGREEGVKWLEIKK